jgi:hypothetical protein
LPFELDTRLRIIMKAASKGGLLHLHRENVVAIDPLSIRREPQYANRRRMPCLLA